MSEKRTYLGDPCIHCGTPHDSIAIGECDGEREKAAPLAYKSKGVRPDGVEHYIVRYSDFSTRHIHSHVSNRLPYYNFGHSDSLSQPVSYDPELN